ncbi:MAG: 5'-nucleotidase [Bacteroidota bacterium]|nr:5'-nucleotidase [Bacteroidota bacterium]
MMKLYKCLIFILLLLTSSCSKHFVEQKTEPTHYSLKEYNENESVKKTLSIYKFKVDSATNSIIASTTDYITKDGANCALGNFCCDALYYGAKKFYKNDSVDLVILNRGGLRINLPKGDIKIGTIFELMPFENELVMVTIKGEKLLEVLPNLADKPHPFYGMKVEINAKREVFATVKKAQIDKTKNYNIITSDYLAYGGDNFSFLKNPVEMKKSNLKIRDVFIDYCIYLTENKRQIIPYTDDRLQISK